MSIPIIAKHTLIGSPFADFKHPSLLHQHRLRRLLFSSMDNQRESETHVHYNHTDPSKYARWTAR